MGPAKMVTVDHTELIAGVQQVMVEQLRRDGRLSRDMELGLLFYAHTPDNVHVVGRVRRCGEVLFELKGSGPHLCAVATQLALEKLRPEERRALAPTAEVRWRTIRFTGESEADALDRFMVDVQFMHQA